MLPFTTSANTDNMVFEYEGSTGYTILQNIFIDKFLPAANGNDVKVYLVGIKKCFGSKDCQWASNKTIAQEAGVSVRAVQRAWRNWESVGLVKIIPRFVKDLNNPKDYRTERMGPYRIPMSNVIRFANLQELAIREAVSKASCKDISDDKTNCGEMTKPSIPLVTKSTVPLLTKTSPKENTILKNYKGEKEQDNRNVHLIGQTTPSQVVSSQPLSIEGSNFSTAFQALCELYCALTGKSHVGQADLSHLTRLLQQYGLEDISDALQEASKGRRRMGNFLRYTEGILQN